MVLRENVKTSDSRNSVGLVRVATRKSVVSRQRDQQEEQHLETVQPLIDLLIAAPLLHQPMIKNTLQYGISHVNTTIEGKGKGGGGRRERERERKIPAAMPSISGPKFLVSGTEVEQVPSPFPTISSLLMAATATAEAAASASASQSSK